MSLTYEDIHSLVKEQSSSARADIARKVAQDYNNSDKFTPRANKIAVDIFRLLLQDTAKAVRKALAEELRDNAHAPHDVILCLARDDYDVAQEILEHSEVLQESDLLELVRVTDDVRKLVSITRRESLTAPVCEALVKTSKPQVVSSLIANDNAELTEEHITFVLDEFRHDQQILESLVCRGDLSYAFAERLYFLVSDRLKKYMTKRYFLSRAVTDKAECNVRENAILKFLSPWMTDEDMLMLVEQMHSRGRLTNSMILRALCLGEVTFFEAALAKRVGIPLANTRKLLRDPGDAGFSSIYRASRLPQEYSEAVRVFLKLVREEFQRNTHRLPDFNQRLAAQIRKHNYDSLIDRMDVLVTFIEHPAVRQYSAFM